MNTKPWKLLASLALGTAFVLVARAWAGPGPMQVEEPSVGGGRPPIQPEKDQESWTARKNASLTPAQQAALKARQETMKDMMALIQQKRRALRDARPEDREALAQELHNLIIEKGLVSTRLDHGKGRMESKRDGSDKLSAADAGDGGKAARLGEDRPFGAAAEDKGRQWEGREESRRRSHEDNRNSRENTGKGRGNGSGRD